jgi:hypothetical protein
MALVIWYTNLFLRKSVKPEPTDTKPVVEQGIDYCLLGGLVFP